MNVVGHFPHFPFMGVSNATVNFKNYQKIFSQSSNAKKGKVGTTIVYMDGFPFVFVITVIHSHMYHLINKLEVSSLYSIDRTKPMTKSTQRDPDK